MATTKNNMLKKSGEKTVKQVIIATLKSYNGLLALPKNMVETCEEVWKMQYIMQARDKKEVLSMLKNNKFRMAYDFMMLRAQVEPKISYMAIWWCKFIESDDTDRVKTLDNYASNKMRRSGSKGFRPKGNSIKKEHD
ncbi:MAG: hypothetical protein HON55_01805 [Legionellales bacterium]|nr:hypothetical protein [Legionellales bacterium]